ncbi:MAG: DUF4381 domain-containing protein, partial [Pseudomonadota bacterium]
GPTGNMEAEDPLAQLADIHLPGDVPFWPPAPGWWMLAGLLLLTIALVGRYFYLQGQTKRKMKSAMYELDQAYSTWQEKSQSENLHNQAGLDLLYNFNSILKRVALLYYPQTDVAKLTGNAWLQFLDGADQSKDFSEGAGKVLSDGTYRPTFSADVDALYTITRRWIMRHYLQPRATKNAPAKMSSDTAEVSA